MNSTDARQLVTKTLFTPTAGAPIPRLPASGGRTVTGAATGGREPLRTPTEDWVIEESFAGTIEEVRDDEVRLHTVSLDGEEATAWLPRTSIPESEQKWLQLGAPIRISIVVDRKAKQVRREPLIRVLRPEQWRVPVTKPGADQIADFVLQRMKSLLTRGG